MDLPRELPIFPLNGCLLLPGNYLPLNVFEPRYLSMVRDAEVGGGYIGMVQPFGRGEFGRRPPESPEGEPEVYPVGCAGMIEESEPQTDGRVHLLLRGVIRFRIRQELRMTRGYRRVEAGYEEFVGDLLEPHAERHATQLLELLRQFGERTGIEFDLDRLQDLPGAVLLNAVCAALPFSPEEKQALLEAAGAVERETLLTELLEMESFRPNAVGKGDPTVH